MTKTIKMKTYDTSKASVVKKITHGAYGDPKGFETTLFQTPEGDYFLYTYGGKESVYAKEAITAFSKQRAEEFLKNS